MTEPLGPPAPGDRLPGLLAAAATLTVVALGLWILADLIRTGASSLSWTFLTRPPADAGRAGGILPIIVSTLWILGICLAVSLPLGVGSALLLSEFMRDNPRFADSLRLSLDMLAGVPSIVFGLFGNAFFSLALGLGFSILSGGLTLACMVLPILIRTVEAGLRAVPDDLRRAGAALGLGRAAVIGRVVLPAAMPGVVAGLTLGIGRALAETAALLFSSGYVDRMPRSWSDSGRALSVHIYDLAMNVPVGDRHAAAAALVLIVLLLAIHALTAAAAGRLGRNLRP